jgi:hypothetical protein
VEFETLRQEEIMADQDLTNDFNSTTSFFSRLFHLFTGPASSGTNADGNSLFSGIENLLKFLFSWLEPQSQQPAAPATTSAAATQSNTPPRTFMGRLRDGFSSAANGVSSFFHGAAFDMSKAIDKLKDECRSKPTGLCLAHVEDALTAGGLRYPGGKTIADVMPVRIGANGRPTHWAKDLPQVLEKDPRFSEVASGYGAKFDASYKPQKGDVVAWTGGKYGHTQMCTGFVDGKPIWISDFETNPGNWTGLANPDSHGEFKIFRQKTAADPAVSANAQPKPVSRQGQLNA